MPLVDRNKDDSWRELLKVGFLGKESDQKILESKILEGIDELKIKLDRQNDLITGLSVMISKMHADGEINNETFNKLDDFLKPYYDNPYGA